MTVYVFHNDTLVVRFGHMNLSHRIVLAPFPTFAPSDPHAAAYLLRRTISVWKPPSSPNR
ncbi:hypothetical protein BDR06DRAFT_963074 [Suillus hirtellus]|nr:hypothetical protein BDR06DRAFT_963074 [Suillus hirtellus]